MNVRKPSTPELNPEIEPYFAAAAQGKLLLKSCVDCGETHFYPRAHCPFCLSANTQWQVASGRGEIYSFTVLRRASVPYAAAYVTLAEGPRMLTNIVRCDLDALAIGQSVRVVFEQSEGGLSIPMFVPLAGAEA
jgi:uncharacterized OB-fold protein